MKILFISKYIRTIKEGTPTRHYFFCENLAKRGHDVKVMKSRASFAVNIPEFEGYYKSEKNGNLDLVTINAPLIKRGFSLIRLWTWMTFEFGVVRYLLGERSYRPDVVVVSSLSIFTFLTGIWLKRKYNVPLIVEVRDIYPLTLTEVAKYSSYNPLVIIMGYIERKGYKNADCIVSSLEGLDLHLKNIMGATAFNFKWIPTGFQEGLYESADATVQEENVLLHSLKADNKFLIGYAGTLGLANALPIIFDAASELEDSHPAIAFVFIGDGPLKEEFIKRYGEKDNIHFMNFVKKQNLPDLLSNFNVLINTWKKSSLYSYGISPNKWNEYMYSGRPFILSHDYGSRIFEEAKCGWQIPTNSVNDLVNVIKDIYAMDPVRINKFGENGRKYLLDKLSYSHLTNLYEEVLESAIEKRENKTKNEI